MPALRIELLATELIGPISLDIAAGECVALMGPSGAGKSLLLRAIVDLDPSSGHVAVGAHERGDMPASEWRKLVALVPAESGWWADRDWIDHNPCTRLEKLAIGDGYEPWPEEMLELVRVHAPDWLRQAVCVARYTGQRRADVLAARWDAIRGDYIRVTQEKTRKQLEIRIHRELSAELATTPRTAVTVLTSTRKRPWTGTGFGSSWRKALVGPLAPIADAGLTFHGLRKNAVVGLLEAGCSEAEVASVTGQSQKMIAHYARRINQRKLSDAAMRKWERTQND